MSVQVDIVQTPCSLGHESVNPTFPERAEVETSEELEAEPKTPEKNCLMYTFPFPTNIGIWEGTWKMSFLLKGSPCEVLLMYTPYVMPISS